MILGFLFFIRTFFLKSIVKRFALKRIDAVNILLYYYIISCIAPSSSTGKLVPMRITQVIHGIPSFTFWPLSCSVT